MAREAQLRSSRLVAQSKFVPGLRVNAWGRCPSLDTAAGKKCATHHLGQMAVQCVTTHPVIFIRPPDPNDPTEQAKVRGIVTVNGASGYQHIVADAIVSLGEYRALVAIQSRDCFKMVAKNTASGSVAIAHFLRNSLLSNGSEPDLLTTLIEAIAPTLSERRSVHIYLSTGISALHFAHEQNLGLVAPFLKRFGPDVFWDVEQGTLDQVAVIRRIATHELGVPGSQIKHDGLCTYTDPRLGSFRGQKLGQNVMLVAPNKHRPN